MSNGGTDKPLTFEELTADFQKVWKAIKDKGPGDFDPPLKDAQKDRFERRKERLGKIVAALDENKDINDGLVRELKTLEELLDKATLKAADGAPILDGAERIVALAHDEDLVLAGDKPLKRLRRVRPKFESQRVSALYTTRQDIRRFAQAINGLEDSQSILNRSQMEALGLALERTAEALREGVRDIKDTIEVQKDFIKAMKILGTVVDVGIKLAKFVA